MILISILGNFHSSILPIFYNFKDQLTHHVIVYDDSKHDRENAQKIIEAQKKFRDNYPNTGKYDYEILPIKINEDSHQSIMNCFNQIKSISTNTNEIYLNATDGLSTVAIVLSSELLKIDANILVYDRYPNTYDIVTKNSITKHHLKTNMNIRDHLKLKGYTLLNYSNKAEVESRKEVVYSLAKDLNEFKAFTYEVHHKKIEDIKGFDKYIKKLKSIDKHNDRQYIQGGVFEEYIYNLIIDYCEFDEVLVGAKVEFIENLVNEFDILMIKDNHLHTIECKLRNSIDGEHFVYKTVSIIDYLDDDGKAMILAIGGENHRKTKKGNTILQFTNGDKLRAKHKNIQVHQRKSFDKKKFLSEVREWFDV